MGSRAQVRWQRSNAHSRIVFLFLGSLLQMSARKYNPGSGGAAAERNGGAGVKRGSRRTGKDWFSHHVAGVPCMTLWAKMLFFCISEKQRAQDAWSFGFLNLSSKPRSYQALSVFLVLNKSSNLPTKDRRKGLKNVASLGPLLQD